MYRMVVVILPPGEEALRPADSVQKFLEPYDESKDVEPYETTCHCKDPIDGGPNPRCHDCTGSGVTLTTFNPDGRFDNWVFGGRWDGWMVDVPIKRIMDLRLRENPFLNMARGEFIPSSVKEEVSSVVDPHGVWHDMVPEQLCFPASKPERFSAYLELYPDHVFVVCEAHSSY